MQSRFLPHLQYLETCWKPGHGVGLSASYSIPDGDDTAIVFELLSRAGQKVDIEAVLSFEEADHFRTYHLELDTSSSVNIHILGALRQAGRTVDDPSVQKALGHLRKRKLDMGCWSDKWHLSPFYTTAHAVIACAGFADELVESSVRWILTNQEENGSWGQQFPTAEETAYCIQALRVWSRHKGSSPLIEKAIWQAADWLNEHNDSPHPPLWIGKGLYCPEMVVRSVIISALKMAQES
jgi:halimadienyl-diphosphate synthase